MIYFDTLKLAVCEAQKFRTERYGITREEICLVLM